MVTMVLAQQAAVPVAVPFDQEPLHHLFISNDTVRVFKVEVPPGGRTLLHRHDRDYLFVTLGESDVINARQGEPARELKLKDGDTAFTPGGFAHVAINNDKQKPFRNITIEIMKPQPDPNPTPTQMLVGAGMSVTFMVDNERAFAEVIELEPGATMPLHEHRRPHLAVPLADATLETDVLGKGLGKGVITQKAGEPRWVEGGFSHTVKNIGTTRARWVQIEIK
jgi:quercetin dioxygenase-like cupin family protein